MQSCSPCKCGEGNRLYRTWSGATAYLKKVDGLGEKGRREAGGGKREAGSGKREAGGGRREAGGGRREAGGGRREAGSKKHESVNDAEITPAFLTLCHE